METEEKPKSQGWEDPFSVSPGIALFLGTIFYLVGRFACYEITDKVVTYVLSGIMFVGLLCDLVINKMAGLGIVLIANWNYPPIPPHYGEDEEPKDD